MSSAHPLAYLDLAADDRFETRVPSRLKRDAETVARARGESLSQYVLRIVAERVAEDFPTTQEWHLTPSEQFNLLRVLAGPDAETPELVEARKRAQAVFGPTPK